MPARSFINDSWPNLRTATHDSSLAWVANSSPCGILIRKQPAGLSWGFRAGNDRLKHLLLDEEVLCHPFIVGELACGTLQKRGEILSMLKALPEAKLLEHDEVMAFLEAQRLYGRDIGWVDAHLLASTLLTGCMIWTFDKPLRRAAAVLNVLT